MSRRLAAVLVLLGFLAGLAIATFSEYRIFLPALLRGAVVTVKVGVLSIALFYAMAFIAGIGRLNKNRIIRYTATVYIEVFRGTSLLVILFWLFFVLPEFGVILSPLAAAVLGMGLNYGAYGAEVVRGAILAVPRGQYEASLALNMTPRKQMLRVVLPQAVLVTIPGLSNLTIELIKATALVSAVTLVDITFASVQQNQIHLRTIDIFVITLLLYYCLAQFVRFGGGMLEARASRHLAKAR
ncbi:MAG: ectoine/hydroxyectoine ABC transporter permease subunit EhuC [Alphaproteobacteria bacterium]|nr:ectoine/hydroxyectoine ABC transporter permease subunit EhuC [Alphaproteobacteria bacterium]MDA7982788.1 ectoine/hydroxyectoine ABC transporter permease subunit EhuC [Alphaproteobacteria bacterium]MDA7988345.1 ectoine/hydroxyectoine ABC transporter permease subunit EhuC [Alphaproteobacteria bacterium]MDA8000981.1 ectoine/hydroxyectoine ABC transporter permease subunit EhuC [Alphaproteobacteria bacterium]MDA8004019.1 ectoine/hydroxyectoine ABC transporter permease subunit EhuC [Alphaproteobac